MTEHTPPELVSLEEAAGRPNPQPPRILLTAVEQRMLAQIRALEANLRTAGLHHFTGSWSVVLPYNHMGQEDEPFPHVWSLDGKPIIREVGRKVPGLVLDCKED